MEQERIKEILQENQRRLDILYAPYDPLTGEGSPLERRKINYTLKGEQQDYAIPVDMYEKYKDLFDLIIKERSIEQFILNTAKVTPTKEMISQVINSLDGLRFDHDFEFWAYKTAKIQDKKSKKVIPFKLNFPQRKYLKDLEDMRMAGVPIREIVLKARQWGGSTLTQVYMAWIQIRHRTNWHSAIVADIEEQSRNISGMYSRLAREYPKELGTLELVPYERSTKSRVIKGRDCVISIGSAQKPGGLRSFDLAMAHFSEAGLYQPTDKKTPEELVTAIRSAVADVPYSLIVLESTAKGSGTFFHREWQAAERGISGYRPIFIPFFEIELYQKKVSNAEKFIEWVFSNEYATFLWNLGATLEAIKWYFDYKKRENYSDWQMHEEYPSTCIAKGTRIGTDKGIICIEDCSKSLTTNTGEILAHINNGIRPVYRLTTKNGYEVICTNDHLIKTYTPQNDLFNGQAELWTKLIDLRIGDKIILAPPRFASDIHFHKWKDDFVDLSVEATPEIGRFLGIFMGDGCYHGECLSIACDANDRDFIDSTKSLVDGLFGVKSHERLTGSNKGCCEIRVSKKKLTEYFLKLGIIEHPTNDGLHRRGYKRTVCVPEIIWKSPREVVAEFLKGVFETDGFNAYKTPCISLFSKHIQFLKDIQLLLLGFGITSVLRQKPARNGNGYKYIANTLTLKGEQADLYRNNIGFLSIRKQSRFATWKVMSHTKRTKNRLFDAIEKIEYIGRQEVFDLTIKDSHQFDASGIMVHNCQEAFVSSGKRVFAPDYVTKIRKYTKPPLQRGDIFGASIKGKAALENLRFQATDMGDLFIWELPDTEIQVSNRYAVIVDIGGRTKEADWSVIKVFDRYWQMHGGKPTVVAVWTGHIDQDLISWKAAQIAKFYNNALLVVESNSLTS
jgi:intein/homing endonuclease